MASAFRKSLTAFAAAVLVVAATDARAGDVAIDAFFGRYEGVAISGPLDGLTTRDLGVVVAPDDEGFRVEWTTTTRRPDGTRKRKAYAISFQPTRRDSVFASAMRRNKFGARVPLDPMRGDPYVWARIVGDTLTVYAMLIVDDGSYEIQVYDRTLTETGLRLEFRRMSGGDTKRAVSGDLTRVGDP